MLLSQIPGFSFPQFFPFLYDILIFCFRIYVLFLSSFQVVLLRTIDVLNTMVECTSDFLAQRMKRDVYPFLHEYLEKNRATSQKGGPMYRFSPTCKVQTRVLRLIGNVVQRLGLSHEDLWQIASACYGYLDCRQPLEIQIVSKNGLLISKCMWF